MQRTSCPRVGCCCCSFAGVVTQLSAELRELHGLIACMAREQEGIAGLDHVGESHEEQAVYAQHACHPFADYLRALPHVRYARHDETPICNRSPKMGGAAVGTEVCYKLPPSATRHFRETGRLLGKTAFRIRRCKEDPNHPIARCPIEGTS